MIAAKRHKKTQEEGVEWESRQKEWRSEKKELAEKQSSYIHFSSALYLDAFKVSAIRSALSGGVGPHKL